MAHISTSSPSPLPPPSRQSRRFHEHLRQRLKRRADLSLEDTATLCRSEERLLMAAEDVLSQAVFLQASEQRMLAHLHATAATFPEVQDEAEPSRKPGPFARFGENACFERYESSASVFSSRSVLHGPIQRISSIPGDPDVVVALSSVQGICTWNWKTDTVISRRKLALRSLVTFEEDRMGIGGMIAGSCDGSILLGSVRVEDCHDDVVYAMDYCAKKRLLLTASADTTIKLWSHKLESEEGWPESRLLLRMTFTGHTSAVTCVLFSPDAEHFISAGDDGDPTVRLWKLNEFAAEDVPHKNASHGGDCAQCAEREDACAQAEAAQHSSAVQERFLLRGEAIDIEPRTISDTDFAANNGGKIRVFHQHGPGQAGPSHAGWINDVKVDGKGGLAVSGSSDCCAKVWEVSTGLCLSTMLCDDWVMSVSFLDGDDSEECSVICTGLANSVITLWLWQESQPLRNFFGLSDAVMHCVTAKDKDFGPLLHSCSYSGEISTWKLTTGPPLAMEPPAVSKISDDYVINVSWTMPVQNGATVEGFRLQVRENELGDFHEIDPKSMKPKLNSLVFKCMIRPAIPGVSYQFIVAAKNRFGYSADSQPSVPRRAPPSVPARIVEPVTISHEGFPVVMWISPDSHGARLQHFIVDVRGGCFEDFGVHLIKVDVKDAARCAKEIMAGDFDEADRDFPVRFAIMERQARLALQKEQPWAVGIKPFQPMALEVKALDPGTTYQFKVVAVNSIGKSESSPHSKSRATAPSVPDAPEEIKGVLSDGYVLLTWNEPKSNGEIILGHHIRISNAATCKAYQRLHASRTALEKQAKSLLDRASELVSAQREVLQEKLDREAMLLHSSVDDDRKRRLLIRASRLVSRILLADEEEKTAVVVDNDEEVLEDVIRHPKRFLMKLMSARSTLVRLNNQGLQPDVWFSKVSQEEARDLGVLVQEVQRSNNVSDRFVWLVREWIRLYVLVTTECYIPLDILVQENHALLKEVQHIDAALKKNAMKVMGREPQAQIRLPPSGESYHFAICAFNACGRGAFSPFSKPLSIANE